MLHFCPDRQGTNVGTSECLALNLTLQPWGFLKISHSHAALVLWTIKALSLLLDHMSALTGQGGPMYSLGGGPNALVWRRRCIASCSAAGRLCAKPPMSMALLSR